MENSLWPTIWQSSALFTLWCTNTYAKQGSVPGPQAKLSIRDTRTLANAYFLMRIACQGALVHQTGVLSHGDGTTAKMYSKPLSFAEVTF